MKKFIYGVSTFVFFALGAAYFWFTMPKPDIREKFVQDIGKEVVSRASLPETEKLNGENGLTVTEINAEDPELAEPGTSKLLDNPRHVFQSFNNCGPATLSMILGWHGVLVSQEELKEKMRPYNNPQGDNDDKTIFTYEFVEWAEKYGLEAEGRVNGDIGTLKKFLANGFPIVVKTWLHPNEDIGHFRLIRGFDDNTEVIIQDDSYEGRNKRFSYYNFLSMWQPFNYAYIVVYPKEKESTVLAILGEERDEKIAWVNSLERAKKEAQLDPDNIYPWFNMSSTYYHLVDYQNSVDAFEKVESKLPKRMLWYQIEPILSYKELGNYDRAFLISNRILENGNKAYSELYILKGEIYEIQGLKEDARRMYELAGFYNINFELPKQKLEQL